MHIHILGICGTFMGSLAQLAKTLGHTVTGSDAKVYPPMSDQLATAGIRLFEGYDDLSQFKPEPDLVVIGNAMSRGNPCVEYVLNQGLAYVSGPQWLSEQVLQQGRWVLAVSGTHGKTTTSSMLAWILEYAGLSPGYLIGGVPENFDSSARLGGSDFFVIEADEYDSAFFDKRSKFVHYRPRTLVINNLEFDHADIFENLAAIQKQFHHVVRTVPSEGLIIAPKDSSAVNEMLQLGCWSKVQTMGQEDRGADWQYVLVKEDGSEFSVRHLGVEVGRVRWQQNGEHNVQNGLAAIAAARHVGVAADIGARALCEFAGVKRRMELLGEVAGVNVYDDFAHHPTAIRLTLEGLRAKVGKEKIVALIEPRSNTMRMGVYKADLMQALSAADDVLWLQPEKSRWSLQEWACQSPVPMKVVDTVEELVDDALALVGSVDEQEGQARHLVVMSNGGFGGIHQLLINRLGKADV